MAKSKGDDDKKKKKVDKKDRVQVNVNVNVKGKDTKKKAKAPKVDTKEKKGKKDKTLPPSKSKDDKSKKDKSKDETKAKPTSTSDDAATGDILKQIDEKTKALRENDRTAATLDALDKSSPDPTPNDPTPPPPKELVTSPSPISTPLPLDLRDEKKKSSWKKWVYILAIVGVVAGVIAIAGIYGGRGSDDSGSGSGGGGGGGGGGSGGETSSGTSFAAIIGYSFIGLIVLATLISLFLQARAWRANRNEKLREEELIEKIKSTINDEREKQVEQIRTEAPRREIDRTQRAIEQLTQLLTLQVSRDISDPRERRRTNELEREVDELRRRERLEPLDQAQAGPADAAGDETEAEAQRGAPRRARRGIFRRVGSGVRSGVGGLFGWMFGRGSGGDTPETSSDTEEVEPLSEFDADVEAMGRGQRGMQEVANGFYDGEGADYAGFGNNFEGNLYGESSQIGAPPPQVFG
nr:hypothetical protein [Sicyoidochytrium minutum DNA virus]